MRLLWSAIEWKVETLAALTVHIEQARQTLTKIEETTWGLELREIGGARFVVLPAGTPDRPFSTVGGRPALKLSSECESCMTALERQLTRPLRELSAQYERERTRHAAQIATLRRQIEHVGGQVTRLTADYRAFAAMLRGRWN